MIVVPRTMNVIYGNPYGEPCVQYNVLCHVRTRKPPFAFVICFNPKHLCVITTILPCAKSHKLTGLSLATSRAIVNTRQKLSCRYEPLNPLREVPQMKIWTVQGKIRCKTEKKKIQHGPRCHEWHKTHLTRPRFYQHVCTTMYTMRLPYSLANIHLSNYEWEICQYAKV